MWKPIPMRTNTNERCGLAYTQSRFGVGFANSISHIKKALEHPRADAEKRRVFQKKIEEHKKDGKPIVYIDESGFAHDMPRTHGYAVKGKRCFGTHDWQARGRINVIGALLGTALLTVGLFTGNINSDVFHGWLVDDLISKLPLGSVLVMDNATFHKRSETKKSIRQGTFWSISRPIAQITILLKKNGRKPKPPSDVSNVPLKNFLLEIRFESF